MISPPLSVNESLWQSSRLAGGAGLRQASAGRDAATCVLAGFAAALSVHVLDFNLRIPGHAILRSVLPVTLGMALAPRRLSGTLIGANALAGTALIRWCGIGSVGWGAFTSLLLIGPLLDATLWQTRGGRAVVLRCAAAGLLANLAAFAIRGGRKLAGWDAVAMRPLADWWSVAAVSYAVCGVLAGFAGALLWFRWSPRQSDSSQGVS